LHQNHQLRPHRNCRKLHSCALEKRRREHLCEIALMLLLRVRNSVEILAYANPGKQDQAKQSTWFQKLSHVVESAHSRHAAYFV
jgi:hypothetical protein